MWTLLSFIDAEKFDSVDDFMEEYGDLKDASQVDKLHEILRPYLVTDLFQIFSDIFRDIFSRYFRIFLDIFSEEDS